MHLCVFVKQGQNCFVEYLRGRQCVDIVQAKTAAVKLRRCRRCADDLENRACRRLMLSPMIDMIFSCWYFYRQYDVYERNKNHPDQVAGGAEFRDRKQSNFAVTVKRRRIVSGR